MTATSVDQLAKFLTVFVNAERFTDSTVAMHFENRTLLTMVEWAVALLVEAR